MNKNEEVKVEETTQNISKEDASMDALKLVVRAKQKCMDGKWKTRQDYRTANSIYQTLCAAEAALRIVNKDQLEAEKKEAEEPMVQGDPNENH